MLKILHLAPQNYAGVPYSFYKMHEACGDKSRLITYHKNPLNFPEDICLDLPLPQFSLAKKWRRKKVTAREENKITEALYFSPGNIFERAYFSLNDSFKRTKIEEAIARYNLNDYDIVHYDAGLDFYRSSSQARKWK